MAETTNYQCPNCNGRLRFDGELGKLKCEFCESTFTAQEVEQIYAERQAKADEKAHKGSRAANAGESQQASVEGAGGATGAAASAAAASASQQAHVDVRGPAEGEDPIDTYLRNAKWENLDQENLRSYNCPSCGAQLMVDQVTAVTNCPYCGNNTVVPGQLSDILKPDYVIPFKLDKEAAISALREYYKGKKFLPNGFTDDNHIEEIQGVYVPFWLYSGTGTGDVTYNARNIRTWSDSENNYVETDHYKAHRVGTMRFAHVPVDGSTKMPDAHMDAIEPFDYSEMVPFSVGYLPGYLTDRYDQDAKTCEERANRRVEATCVEQLQSTVNGYMEVDVDHASSQLALNNVAYALLPVWMLHTRWNDEDYLFAMNGQTGKLVGDLPIDNRKVIRRFLLIFFPLAIILAVAMYFLYL